MPSSLPQAFVDMLRGYGKAYSEALIDALLASVPQVSVRVNKAKGCAVAEGADRVPWCEDGFYLSARPLFAADPLWHAAAYYVQDASSMVYTKVVKSIVGKCFGTDKLRYLDACAAPGGKTIAAIEALGDKAFIVANEYERSRCNILEENLCKWGRGNIAITRGDARAFGKLASAFDIIAVDAPCSGEGMMRKEAEAVAQWSPRLIEQCALRQRDIVADLWRALRPGGVMIYSTCTFNRAENEEIVQYLCDEFGAESIALNLDEYPGVFKGVETVNFCYRFAPGHIRGEGLFVAAVRKPGVAKCVDYKSKTKVSTPSEFAIEHLELSPDDVEFTFGDHSCILPKEYMPLVAEIQRITTLVRAGLPIYSIKGRDIVPAHCLAMSTRLKMNAFSTLALDYQGALAYLRGEAIQDIECELPKGYVVVTYNNMPLGFVKNIGRRANNLYPEPYRLRLPLHQLPQTPDHII